MKRIYKLLTSAFPLALLSACASGPAETPQAPGRVAQAKPVCHEDIPTGSRLNRARCSTADPDRDHQKSNQ
jgi:hypothetical protein